MLTWKNILTIANKGNPTPDRTTRKTDQEWRTLLTDEQYRVTRQHVQRSLLAKTCAACLNQEYMLVYAVLHCYSMQTINLNRVPDGFLFHNL